MSAASTTQLFFEVVNGVFVQSDTEPNQLPPQIFVAGDVRALLLKLVRRTSPNEVDVIDLAGITTKVGIGSPAKTPTIYASATSAVQDANGFLPISLDLSVTAVQTALGTESEIDATFEVQIIGASDPQRKSAKCKLRQRLLT